MSNAWNQIIQKLSGTSEKEKEPGEKRKKLKKEQWFMIVLCGVLLVILAMPLGKKSGGETLSDDANDTFVPSESPGAETKTETDYGEMTLEEYTESMEKKLEEALSDMAGVGEVRVVITMASSTEKVVEKEQPVNRSNTAEIDSQGGSRNVNTVEMGDTTVYSTQSGESIPYVVKVMQPKVEGVMVVAQGAGNGSVNKNITEAIQALFGIEAHKIKVVKMKTP